MTQNEIEQQIESELEKFKNENYKGSVAVPDNLIELFKNAYMFLAPHFHGIMANKVKVIASKHKSQLTNDDISTVIKLIVNIPINKIYEDEDFESAIKQHITFEKFILGYNQHVHSFQENLKQKKANLINLARNVSNTGLKILRN